MLKLHWGAPKHPTEIRAYTGVLCSNRRPPQHHFTSHGVARWFGLSFGRSWFVGFSRFGRSINYSTQDPPRVGLDEEIITIYVEEARA